MWQEETKSGNLTHLVFYSLPKLEVFSTNCIRVVYDGLVDEQTILVQFYVTPHFVPETMSQEMCIAQWISYVRKMQKNIFCCDRGRVWSLSKMASCGNEPVVARRAIFLGQIGKLVQKQSDCFGLGSNPVPAGLEPRTLPPHFTVGYSASFLPMENANQCYLLWSGSHPILQLSDALRRWTNCSLWSDIFRAQWQIQLETWKFYGVFAFFLARRKSTN